MARKKSSPSPASPLKEDPGQARNVRLEARDACRECAERTADLINFVHADPSDLPHVHFARDGTRVDRPIGPSEFASIAQRIWDALQRACGPLLEMEGRLAGCNLGAPTPFAGITRPSYHETAFEIAFGVLNNARIVAGYQPIFPRRHRPHGIPAFLEQCRDDPDVFSRVAAEGFTEIGTQWEAVRSDLKVNIIPFSANRLTGLIQKEAALVAATGTVQPGPPSASGQQAPEGGAAPPEGDSPSSHRGRRSRYDATNDQEIALEWERARGAKVPKKQFAKGKHLSFKELNKILTRVRKRRSRARK